MPSTKIFAAVAAVIGWIALILQLYLIIVNRTASIPETLLRYFGFFTILTNILVAVSLTMVYIKGISENGHFLTRPKTLTATAVYITIVGLIYNVILRFQWAPQGLAKLVDELLHSVIPVLFIFFWVKFVPKQNIQWKNILPWLIYPLVYLGYTLLRGSFAAWYPYPFINVTDLGYGKVLMNSVMVTVAFVVIAVLFAGIAKAMSKRSA
ncbi:Pr6Pr family membrane protein [Ferruginibacter sp.]|nr:Pr6Pr family membrane protein [Ferruginibacter sp.]